MSKILDYFQKQTKTHKNPGHKFECKLCGEKLADPKDLMIHLFCEHGDAFGVERENNSPVKNTKSVSKAPTMGVKIKLEKVDEASRNTDNEDSEDDRISIKEFFSKKHIIISKGIHFTNFILFLL